MRPLVLAPWVFTLFASLALPVQAQVYKCRLPSGQTEISSQPCRSGTTLEVRQAEKVSEADRLAVERELERARSFIEKSEAEHRADAAAELERERLLASQQRTTVSNQSRQYSNSDACLRDVAQMPLDAMQRNQMENDCRRIISSPQPQTIYVPYPVAVPVTRPMPQHTHPAQHGPVLPGSVPTVLPERIQPRK